MATQAFSIFKIGDIMQNMANTTKKPVQGSARVAVDAGAVFSRYANFYSAAVNKNEAVILFGEKSTIKTDNDFVVHTKIAMSLEGAKKLSDLLSSLIKKAEENEK